MRSQLGPPAGCVVQWTVRLCGAKIPGGNNCFRRAVYLIPGLALLLAASACNRQASIPERVPLPANAVARIDDFILTDAAFQAELDRRSRADPGRYATLAQKEALLDELLRFEILYRQAKTAGYEQNPQVQAGLRRLMVRQFEEDHAPAQRSAPAISEEEILAYYQAHGARFGLPEQRQGAIIFIRVPATATAEKKAELHARAEAIRAEALKQSPGESARKDFGQLAQRHSEDQATRYRGGDMGWLEQANALSRWEAPVVEALFALEQPAALSPVITTPQGLYLVKLLETKPARLRPLSEVKDGVQYWVAKEKETQADRDFYATQKAKVEIEINRALLESLTPSRTQVELQPPRLPGS